MTRFHNNLVNILENSIVKNDLNPCEQASISRMIKQLIMLFLLKKTQHFSTFSVISFHCFNAVFDKLLSYRWFLQVAILFQRLLFSLWLALSWLWSFTDFLPLFVKKMDIHVIVVKGILKIPTVVWGEKLDF